MTSARNVSPADIVRNEIEKRAKLDESAHPRLNQVIRQTMNGQAIGEYEARYLAAAFGSSQEFWLNLQAAYDSRDATEQHVTGSIGAIPQGIVASDSIEWDGERVTVKRKGAK